MFRRVVAFLGSLALALAGCAPAPAAPTASPPEFAFKGSPVDLVIRLDDLPNGWTLSSQYTPTVIEIAKGFGPDRGQALEFLGHNAIGAGYQRIFAYPSASHRSMTSMVILFADPPGARAAVERLVSLERESGWSEVPIAGRLTKDAVAFGGPGQYVSKSETVVVSFIRLYMSFANAVVFLGTQDDTALVDGELVGSLACAQIARIGSFGGADLKRP